AGRLRGRGARQLRARHRPLGSHLASGLRAQRSGGAARMDVLLVAVKKDKILNHTNVLAQAGKTPVIVDIDAFGLQNCFEVNYEPDGGQTVALLNIGASVMNINIVRGGIPLFTRDVSVGGNQYTDALQKELDLSFEDAERLKKGETLP